LIVIPIRLPVPITPAAGPGFAAGAGVGCVATGAGGVARGVRRTGAGGSSRLGVGRGARARDGSGFGAGAAFVGAAFVVPPIGASLNTVCGGAWRCANAMSRANAESAAALASELERSRHAAKNARSDSAGNNRRTGWIMGAQGRS
jgi:hypothetical protein